MTPAQDTHSDAVIIFFNEYTVHYYSQSSAPCEAAYINCFAKNRQGLVRQVGTMIFTYADGTTPPGQENAAPGALPTKVPVTQINHLELRNGQQFFVVYYQLNRFDDVINQLRYAVDELSMFISADARAHVWAVGNNLHAPVGARCHT